MKKSYYIETMGCQMNAYDSDCVGRVLSLAGYGPVHDPRMADVILINTCAVRAKAEQKAFSALGRMIALKRRRPGMILGIMGCVAQKGAGCLLEKYSELDLVLGPGEVGRFPELLAKVEKGRSRVEATAMRGTVPPPVLCEGFFKGKVKASMTVMEGCNNFCSYCIVPYVRGREVSRPPEDILNEARYLVGEGVREITLLGQNVNSYIYENRERVDFADLLRRLERIDGLWRIRFTTSHPKDLSTELIQCFAECQKLCAHLHLPFRPDRTGSSKP